MTPLLSTLLVSLDGTDESMVALHYGVLLAAATGARLHVAYIVNTRALGDLVRSHIFVESEEAEYRRDMEADAGRYLSHAQQLAAEKGVRVVTHKLNGSVHQELIALIRTQAVDLLILGELPTVRSRRDELHNDTERAMRSAPCSVLIAKDEEHVYAAFEAAAENITAERSKG